MNTEKFEGHYEASEALALFRRGGDRNHADHEFDFTDLLLIAPLAQTARPPASDNRRLYDVSDRNPRSRHAIKAL